MLTSDDLQKIGDLIDIKLEQKLEQKLEEKLEQKLEPIKKDLRLIKADLRATIKFFDDDISHLKKRVGRIEEYIGINNGS